MFLKAQTILAGLASGLAGFARDRRGVTTLEYGILAAGVAVVIGLIVADDGVFKQTIEELFNRILNALPTTSGSGGGGGS